jgi:hypothetical protein
MVFCCDSELRWVKKLRLVPLGFGLASRDEKIAISLSKMFEFDGFVLCYYSLFLEE